MKEAVFSDVSSRFTHILRGIKDIMYVISRTERMQLSADVKFTHIRKKAAFLEVSCRFTNILRGVKDIMPSIST